MGSLFWHGSQAKPNICWSFPEVLCPHCPITPKTPNSWRGCIYDSFACSWESFPPNRLPYPASIWGLSSSFVLKVCYLLETTSFLKRKGRGSGSRRDGRCVGELEGVQRGETVVRMSCMREKSIFNWTKGKKIAMDIYAIDAHICLSVWYIVFVSSAVVVKYPGKCNLREKMFIQIMFHHTVSPS